MKICIIIVFITSNTHLWHWCNVFADHIEDPKGGFMSGSMSGWKVFMIIIIAIIGLAVCGVVGYVVFNKDGGYNSKRFY